MKKIFENIGWNLLGIFMILLVLSMIIVWFGMIFVWCNEWYDKNPNSLFIIIPTFILLHIWVYLTIKHTRL